MNYIMVDGKKSVAERTHLWRAWRFVWKKKAKREPGVRVFRWTRWAMYRSGNRSALLRRVVVVRPIRFPLKCALTAARGRWLSAGLPPAARARNENTHA